MTGRGRHLGRVAAASLGSVALLAGVLSAPVHAGMPQEFSPCLNRPAKGDEGEFELTIGSDARRKLARERLTATLLDPARWLGTIPVYPVRNASDTGGRIVARLGGGFAVRGDRGRGVKVVLTRFVKEAGSVPRIEGRIDGRSATVFRVSGLTVRSDLETRQTELDRGRVAVAPALAKRLKRKAGARGLGAGSPWGRLYLTWDETTPPAVSTPDPPGPFIRPAGAVDLAGATITWRVREKWIQYVASGSGSNAVRGAVPGETEVIDGKPPLVYEYTFPFTGGWVKDGPTSVESASVTGSGGVRFRYCGSSKVYKGINFIVHSPELEIDGTSARLIFSVLGVDATPFSDTRAVVVDLGPVPPEGGGQVSTWEGIAGVVPETSRGIFGNFYDGGTEFGSVTLSIDRGSG